MIRDILGVQNNLIFDVKTNIQFLIFFKFYFYIISCVLGSKYRHGIFWGLAFSPGIFIGLVGSPSDFLVLIFTPIRSSPSIEIQIPEYPPGTRISRR